MPQSWKVVTGVHVVIIPFGKEMCHHLNEIKVQKVQESVGSELGDQHPVTQGVTGQPKINYFIMCLIACAY